MIREKVWFTCLRLDFPRTYNPTVKVEKACWFTACIIDSAQIPWSLAAIRHHLAHSESARNVPSLPAGDILM